MEELEARVTALEGQVRGIREDVAAARVLAGGADRDVSAFAGRLDANQRLLEALRDTQIEHGERLTGQHQLLATHSEKLDELESEMRRGFSTLAVGQAEILALLNRKVEAEAGPPSAE
jgi:chromosome segregation ATPase